jgi:hypothetical protein
MPRHFGHGREQALIAYAALAQLLFHHGAALRGERLCSISVHASLLPSAYVNIETQNPILVSHRYDGYVLIDIVFHLDHGFR